MENHFDEQAELYLLKELRERGRDPQIHEKLGDLYAGHGPKKDKAAQYYGKAVELLIARFAGRPSPDRLAEAEDILRKMLSLDPASERAFLGLAEIYERAGNVQKARETYENLLKILDVEQRPLPVIAALHKLISLDPNSEEHRIRSAEVKTAIGFKSSASDDYVAAARILSGRQEWQKAERQYRLAVERNPDNTEALSGLAAVSKKLGEEEEAASLLLRAARKYMVQGDARKAAECLKQSLDLRPGNEEAVEELKHLQLRDTGGEDGASPRAPSRILFCSRDRFLYHMLAGALRREAVDVILSENPEELAASIVTDTPLLALLDEALCPRDLQPILTRLKVEVPKPSPVAFIADPSSRDRMETMSPGPDRVLYRPVSLPDLLASIRDFLPDRTAPSPELQGKDGKNRTPVEGRGNAPAAVEPGPGDAAPAIAEDTEAPPAPSPEAGPEAGKPASHTVLPGAGVVDQRVLEVIEKELRQRLLEKEERLAAIETRAQQEREQHEKRRHEDEEKIVELKERIAALELSLVEVEENKNHEIQAIQTSLHNLILAKEEKEERALEQILAKNKKIQDLKEALDGTIAENRKMVDKIKALLAAEEPDEEKEVLNRSLQEQEEKIARLTGIIEKEREGAGEKGRLLEHAAARLQERECEEMRLKDAIRTVEEKNSILGRDLKALQERHALMAGEADALGKEMAALRQEKRTIEDGADRLILQLGDLESRNRGLAAEIEALGQTHGEVLRTTEAEQAKLVNELQARLEASRERVRKLQDENEDLTAILEHGETAVQEGQLFHSRYAREQQRLLDHERSVEESLNQEKHRLQEELGKYKARQSAHALELSEREAELEKKHQQLRSTIEFLEFEREELKRKLSAVHEKYDGLSLRLQELTEEQGAVKRLAAETLAARSGPTETELKLEGDNKRLVAQIREKEEAYRKLQEDFENRLHGIETMAADLEAAQRALREQRSELEEWKSRYEETARLLRPAEEEKGQTRETEEGIEKLREELERARALLEQREQSLQQGDAAVQTREERIREQNETIRALEEKLESLAQAPAALPAETPSSRRVLEAASPLPIRNWRRTAMHILLGILIGWCAMLLILFLSRSRATPKKRAEHGIESFQGSGLSYGPPALVSRPSGSTSTAGAHGNVPASATGGGTARVAKSGTPALPVQGTGSRGPHRARSPAPNSCHEEKS